jgi:hypothetical protein
LCFICLSKVFQFSCSLNLHVSLDERVVGTREINPFNLLLAILNGGWSGNRRWVWHNSFRAWAENKKTVNAQAALTAEHATLESRISPGAASLSVGG